MGNMELKETLMEGAKDGGICADGYGKIRAYDRDEVIDYYLGNLDWCMERGFPQPQAAPPRVLGHRGPGRVRLQGI